MEKEEFHWGRVWWAGGRVVWAGGKGRVGWHGRRF